MLQVRGDCEVNAHDYPRYSVAEAIGFLRCYSNKVPSARTLRRWHGVPGELSLSAVILLIKRISGDWPDVSVLDNGVHVLWPLGFCGGVWISPCHHTGAPCVANRRVPTRQLVRDDVDSVALDYDLTREQVRSARRFESIIRGEQSHAAP